LYLINPAGVLFGAESSINLAGDFTVLTAERLDFSQGNFDLSGHPTGVKGNVLQLQFDSEVSGTIVNLGDLRVGANRSLSLIGHSVVNQGTLRGGAINIAAVGAHETVSLAGGLQFVANTLPTTQHLPPWLTPTGSEHATTLEIGPEGTLRLVGSPLSEIPLGTALVSGQIVTTHGLDRIQILGAHIAAVGATIRTANGGQILIGGDYQGRGFLPTAQSTFIDEATSITANGEAGGQVVIWSDELTQFKGIIRAQGDIAGGNVEVSGKERLLFDGQVDVRSQGSPGTLLLDPENIEIRAGSDPGGTTSGNSQILYESTLESSIVGNINLWLQADNDITIGPLSDGKLTFAQGTGSISFLADADGDGQGSFTMASSNCLNAPGQNIFITAADIIAGDVDTSVSSIINNSKNAGDIHLTATRGSLITGNLSSTARGVLNNSGNGGDISLSAMGSVATGDIITTATALNNSGSSGQINFRSQAGKISTDHLNASTFGNNNSGAGGEITLNGFLGIDVADITTSAQAIVNNTGDGGDISLVNLKGDILTGSLTANTGANVSNTGSDGEISITTPQGEITSPEITAAAASPGSTSHGGYVRLDADGTQSITQIYSDTLELDNLFKLQPSLSNTPATESALSTLPLSPDSAELETINFVGSPEKTTKRAGREQGEGISNSEIIWTQMETTFSAEFAAALNLPVPVTPSLQSAQQTLRQVSDAQNITPALMYVRLKDTHVELMLMHGEGPPIYRPVAATAAEVQAVVETFHQSITNPMLRPAQYLPAAQQLYDWFIRPMLDDLEVANVDHIGFVLDMGLRSLPMAALHDGQQFLIENYSIGLLPSLGLTNLEPSLKLLSESKISEPDTTLAMGIANFEEHADLAAVPLELALASHSNSNEYYLDHEATLGTLQQRLDHGSYTSLHLATHAVFQPGSLDESYIQLWDQTVKLNQLKTLPLDAIDFLILSACATALGDAAAEYGFAGLAVTIGVQTVLASLWSISDEGTLGLMSEFYQAPELSRSAALRQAQLAMLQGQVGIVDGTVYGSGNRTIGHLPNLDTSGSWDFSHPAYWSGFVMIGNPW
ncbi:MAG: CHAT domain-containing protein, partial [Cyanobacteria bacterium P01_H01_bin.105]